MEHLKKEKILGFPLPVVLLFCVIVFAARECKIKCVS